MAAVRSGLPISWTSEQMIDREKIEIQFHHLKALTKGMRVVWSFNETPAGILVEIMHELRFRIRALAPVAERIIGNFFIHHIAGKTLACMKTHLESAGDRSSPMRPSNEKASRSHYRAWSDHLHRNWPRRFLAGAPKRKERHPTISSFDTTAFNAHCGGEIPDWVPEDYFPPHRLKRLDRYAQFAVASAKMALDDAGLPYSHEEPQHRIGVSFGTALGGISNAEDQHAHFLKKGTRGVNQTLALQVFGGSAHSNIAIEFGFRGVGTTNSNSCASGTIAVGEALRYIRDDFADVIVAGGAESPLSPLTFGAFAIIRTMSQWTGDPALACRPFDLNAMDSSSARARLRSSSRRWSTRKSAARTFSRRCLATV